MKNLNLPLTRDMVTKTMNPFRPSQWKKPKKVKIPGEPKKALSAYFHYQASVRSNYQGVPFGEQAKLIAAEWKKLTDKSKYEELAVQDKQRYIEEKGKFDAEQKD